MNEKAILSWAHLISFDFCLGPFEEMRIGNTDATEDEVFFEDLEIRAKNCQKFVKKHKKKAEKPVLFRSNTTIHTTTIYRKLS